MAIAKVDDGIDTSSRWWVHAHRGTTCDRESFMCVDAHSSESAAFQGVTSYWNECPDRRHDLFDYAEPATPTITVVVYGLPEPDERSGPGPQDWVGTVIREHPDGEEVTIRVDRK